MTFAICLNELTNFKKGFAENLSAKCETASTIKGVCVPKIERDRAGRVQRCSYTSSRPIDNINSISCITL